MRICADECILEDGIGIVYGAIVSYEVDFRFVENAYEPPNP